MLKRVIENWLTSISEREFDIPFRLLLEAEGHTAINHTTVHGPMELGKDVVSWHPEERTFYFFQLKAGNINNSSWSEMERQVMQLVTVPYVHPNYRIGDPYSPVWVCTGELSEVVRNNLGLTNLAFSQMGKPTVAVWDRNILIEKFHSAFYELVLINDALAIDFIRLWSHATDYMTDEEQLRELFHSFLAQTPSSSGRPTEKHLATYVLILAQFGQHYMSLDDPYSRIDATVLGITQLYEWTAIVTAEAEIYHNSLSALTKLLSFYLQELIDQCDTQPELLHDMFEVEHGWAEIFELPLRVHSLASKIALKLLLNDINGEDHEKEAEMLAEIIKNNPAFCHLISERQMGTFWICVVALLKVGQTDLAKMVVGITVNRFMSFHGQEGLLGLPDPYQPYSAGINHHLRVETDHFRLINKNGSSYLLPILMKFMTLLDMRGLMEHHWKILSHFTLHEYRPSTLKELFTDRANTGKMATYTLPITGSWSAIKAQYSERLQAFLSDYVDAHPGSLLILAMAYPWRTQWRETDRYIRSALPSIHRLLNASTTHLFGRFHVIDASSPHSHPTRDNPPKPHNTDRFAFACCTSRLLVALHE